MRRAQAAYELAQRFSDWYEDGADGPDVIAVKFEDAVGAALEKEAAASSPRPGLLGVSAALDAPLPSAPAPKWDSAPLLFDLDRAAADLEELAAKFDRLAAATPLPSSPNKDDAAATPLPSAPAPGSTCWDGRPGCDCRSFAGEARPPCAPAPKFNCKARAPLPRTIEALEARVTDLESMLIALKAHLAAAWEDAARQREFADKYGEHLQKCAIWVGNPYTCTCGFILADAAREKGPNA